MSKKILLQGILLIAGLFLFSAAEGNSPLKPVQPRVEYLEYPRGLDVEKPRFSWVLESEDPQLFGQKQTAYRIIVASTLEKAMKNKGDVWKSGWRKSNDMSGIEYAGKKLASDRRYFWKVQIKDEKGQKSSWSDINWWSTGIFEADAWKGEWIGSREVFDPAEKECNIWDPWLRKSFVLEKKPGKAVVFVASIGYHDLYVNGQKVGKRVLSPAVSDHTKRARYIAYDIHSYLNKGKNVIALWLGTSWSVFPGYVVDDGRPLTPLVAAQVDFYEEDFPKPTASPYLTITTDDSWKIKNSPNKLTGTWDFRQMGGEHWDDRKREDQWNLASYDDSSWENAEEYSLDLTISAQQVEGNMKFLEVRPVKIEERPDGTYRVDMGVNFAGWTEVKVAGQEGDKIEFLYSEREQEEMTFNLHSSFVIGPDGEGTFENRFNYSSGRWITIRGLKKKPEADDIRGWMVRTNYKKASEFECSDPLQNWMYDRITWTYENLSLGGFIVDCPQRERMGYGGDAHATSETGLMNYHLGAFYSKWMEDWRDVQGTEPMVGNMRDPAWARQEVTSGRLLGGGILPHTAPTYWGGGGPAWGGIVVSLPWFIYEHYGDTRILEENFELMRGWLSFLDSHVENDLLQRFGGQWDFLGDWLWPNATAEGMNNDSEETLCLNNSYRVFNLRTAAKTARVLGKEREAEEWEKQAEASSRAIDKTFYHAEDGSYSDGSMANQAAALLAEVVSDSEKSKVIKRLEDEILIHRKGHIHAGITGGALLFKWLRQEGRNDLIYSMTSRKDYPSWGYMMENDATTIWEMWEKDLPGHSLLHSSYLYPGAWYIDGVTGIKKVEPGFRKFAVEPPTGEETGLKWARASFESPSGRIEAEWSREGGTLSLSVSVPPNTVGVLKLESAEAGVLKEKEGVVRKIGSENGKEVFELQPGQHHF